MSLKNNTGLQTISKDHRPGAPIDARRLQVHELEDDDEESVVGEQVTPV